MRLPETKIEIVPGGHRFLGKGCEAISDSMLYDCLSRWFPSNVLKSILTYFYEQHWDGIHQLSVEIDKQAGIALKSSLKNKLNKSQRDAILKVLGGIDGVTTVDTRKYNSIVYTFNLCLRTLLHTYSVMKGSNDFVPFTLTDNTYVTFPERQPSTYYSNNFTFSFFYEKTIPSHYYKTKLRYAVELLEQLGLLTRVGVFLPEKENKYSKDLVNYCKSVERGKQRKAVNCSNSCYRLSYEMEYLFDNLFYVNTYYQKAPTTLTLSDKQKQTMAEYKKSKVALKVKKLENNVRIISNRLRKLDEKLLSAPSEDLHTSLNVTLYKLEIVYSHFKIKLQDAQHEYENL